MTERRSITALIPCLDEADNMPFVLPELVAALELVADDFSIIVIDDGSRDGTADAVRAFGETDERVSVISHRRNLGKSAALKTGFHAATGDLILLMDGDGQDDPSEIANMLASLDDGNDMVTGRRSVRNDRFIKRNTSKIYNAATSRLSGVEGRDFNSGFKLFDRQIADDIPMYGELHRYIPVLAFWQGYRVTEVTVNHRQRHAGSSKFGIARFWRGLLDLITVKFLTTYDKRPFHLFGALSAGLGALGFALLLWMFVLKVMGEGIGQRPALVAGVLLVVVAVQLASLGLIAELLVSFRQEARERDRDGVSPVP